tara:strand:- start:475 stop:1032 length:558 start_codon:yes stop_codon:yes gene_type:complete
MKSSKKIQDAWLITQYREGHKNAMAVLVKRWHLVFCRQAYRYCKDAAIAKDLAQDAWITILAKIDGLEKPEKFGSWGLSIVTTKSIDWYRKNRRTDEAKQGLRRAAMSIDPEENQLQNPREAIQQLKLAIALLSEGHQKVLSLFYIESYDLNEISSILQISKGTVKSRLFYAREHLKTTLKKEKS